jgi:hypothetical protein
LSSNDAGIKIINPRGQAGGRMQQAGNKISGIGRRLLAESHLGVGGLVPQTPSLEPLDCRPSIEMGEADTRPEIMIRRARARGVPNAEPSRLPRCLVQPLGRSVRHRAGPGIPGFTPNPHEPMALGTCGIVGKIAFPRRYTMQSAPDTFSRFHPRAIPSPSPPP